MGRKTYLLLNYELESSVLKLYFQTYTPDIVVQIIKKKRIPWRKAIQQVTDCLYREQTLKNGTRTVPVVKNFIHRLDVVIDRKGCHLEHFL